MQLNTNPADLAVGVIGAGSWGTTLADLLAQKGYRVDLWVYEEQVKEQIASRRENETYLPGIRLSANIRPSNDLAAAIGGKQLIVVVVPSHTVRQTARAFAAHLADDAVIVTASKGIENGTLLPVTGVLRDVLPHVPTEHLAVLSGPSFAREVARRVPTAVTVACPDDAVAACVQQVFATPFFRVYTNNDVIGTELGGAVKNVIAIAAGIADGLGLGHNSQAALITRGLTEIRRLGLKMGANPRTFTGLAGMGDLVLTCTGKQSRNHTVGEKIGQGRSIGEITAGMQMVAEGIKTAKSIYNLSRRLDVDMPICRGVYGVLYEGHSPAAALKRLLNRELKPELDEL